MSKIIATRAIRGAQKLVSRAEKELEEALASKGPDTRVEFPNTGYYLPISHGILGLRIETLRGLQDLLEEAKRLLPPIPEENLWVPFLGHTLDAGMATLFADEIIEAIKYTKSPLPYLTEPNPDEKHLWLGAANDIIMRERGIEFVDGTAPGFAACVGYCPTNEIAVRLARELQEKNLYVFMSASTDGKSMAQQLREEGIQLGWETRLVPFGDDVTATVHSLGFATRVALSFGGAAPMLSAPGSQDGSAGRVGSRWLTIIRSPPASTMTADTDELQPGQRRRFPHSTPCASNSLRIISAAASSPTRAASTARPPSLAIATAAVAAGPPPTLSKRVARYFSPRSGSAGT